MSVKLTEHIQVNNDVFTVTTTTRFLFISKPHSAVIPFRLDGKLTMERGFTVEYTTDDTEILEAWHSLLCDKVRVGLYREMLEQARQGLFPLEEDESEMAPYVKGFRCK